LARSIKGAKVDFYFVITTRINGGAAAGTEKSSSIIACLATNFHRIQGKYCGRIEKSSMMLTAIKAVANADPVWVTGRHNSNVSANATTCIFLHDMPSISKPSKLDITNPITARGLPLFGKWAQFDRKSREGEMDRR